MPCSIASLGECISTFFPFMKISPENFLSAPMISLAISVLPAPTNPANPTISPLCTQNEVF